MLTDYGQQTTDNGPVNYRNYRKYGKCQFRAVGILVFSFVVVADSLHLHRQIARDRMPRRE